MRLPFFGSAREDGPLRIAVPEMVNVGFGVYFRAGGAAPPTSEALKAAVRDWLDAHTADPLRSAIRGFLDRDLLTVEVGTKDRLPAPPWEFLRHIGYGEAEERRFHEATHLAAVWAPSPPTLHPAIGLWSAIGAARAVAMFVQGVILDPEIPRFQPIVSYDERLPDDARIKVVEHINIFHSIDERGQIWMTTKGMSKFGLPDVGIRDIPPNLTRPLGPVMNGVARILARAVVRQAREQGGLLKELVIGPEIRFGVEDLAEEPPAGSLEPPEGARGWTMLRLGWQRPRRDMPAFIRLVPPRGFQGDQGVWLNSLLSDLLGSKHEMRSVRAGSETMEAAHRRAVAELPAVKRRFQAQLSPGTTLYVKHGFPLAGGGHEFMWVVVNTWTGDRLRGQLANDPRDRLDLRAGQSVELREADVYDWMISHRDGSTEGGYTSSVAMDEGREHE